jgi:dipeptidyl aminopeptidase/acylaminoacyl peptidase
LWVFGAVCAALWPSMLHAQGSKADYERAESLARLTRNTVGPVAVRPNWLPGGDRFWYRNDLPHGVRSYVFVDAVKGERRAAFDHARLAEALSKQAGREVNADRLDLTALTFDDEGKALTFESEGRAYRCDLGSYDLDVLPEGERPKAPADPPRAGRPRGDETELVVVNRTAGPIELIWMSTDGDRQSYGTIEAGATKRQHTFGGHQWLVLDREGKELARIEATDEVRRVEVDGQAPTTTARPQRSDDQPARGRGRAASRSPDGRHEAAIKDHNVVIRSQETGEELVLSSDGDAEDAYVPRFFWSPDSSHLIVIRERPAQEHKVYLVESSPRDQLQPKLQSIDYLKPGDRIAHPRPRLFDVEGRKQVPVSDDLFPEPWSIGEYDWAPDSSRFCFLCNQRGHQVLRVVSLDARTGEACALIDERSPTFIDYSNKTFLRYLDETQEMIWMSERDGWNHLYLVDARDGTVKNAITGGEWLVRRVDRVDVEKRQVWFRALGIYPDQDPYHVHFARVNFDGTGLTVLTEGDGIHDVAFSPDGRSLIDTYSRVDMPPVIELRRADDGKLVCELERADWSGLLATGWRAPERYVAPGRDGHTPIHGVIWRPTNFDAGRRYPVIEQIYAGPHGAFVPKSFAPYHGTQALAELGFIVVQVDGMGTNWRSKAFHDVCWRDLADAGFPDRIAWMKAAAAQHPEMDLTRVGIYGGSAGGQNALGGLLLHGDFYKVGAADCGCHDNRMDKIWWNEAWMGWPVGSHYAESSNVTHAAKLTGKLLLTVGELDKNVDPASTMQVVNALIRANKDFDLIVFPGGGHGSGGGPYGDRRRKDFFVRHLWGVEPRHD